MSANKPARVAVIGTGRWGRNLARNFRNLGALAAIIDSQPETAREQAEISGCPWYLDLDSALAGTEFSALAVATPAETHAEFTRQALVAGLDVFVEKPMALRLADAEAMHQMAEDRRRILMVGHLLLYHPAFLALKELVRHGALGDIRYIYSNRLNLGRVRREENILWSFAPHDIAAILDLAGEEPIGVEATGGSWLQQNVADITVTHLSFSSGTKAHVFVSWLHPYKEQRLVVVGSRKMAVFNDLEPRNKVVVADIGIDFSEAGLPLERLGLSEVIEFSPEEPLAVECRHFLECCQNRTTPRTGGVHGTAVMRVLEQSARQLR